jgi:outer membrane protein OmpA-like peptidoglycan-associated protein
MRPKSITLVSLFALMLATATVRAQIPASGLPEKGAPGSPVIPITTPTTPPLTGARPTAAPFTTATPAETPLASPAMVSTDPSLNTATDEPVPTFVPQLSLGGPIGLFRLSTTDIGAPYKLRLGIHGEYFSTSGFLVEGANASDGSDRNKRFQGALSFSATATDSLEIFGAVLGSANRNKRLCATNPSSNLEVCQREAGATDPELIKSFGDLILGAKLGLPIADGFSAGAELGFRFLSSVDGISFSGDSTSFWLGGIAGYDLGEMLPNAPLRLHVNLGYYVDKSSNLQDYNALGTMAFSRYVSSFAYGISHSRLRFGLGADLPLVELAEGFSLRPLLEYHLEYLNGDMDQVIYSQERLTCGGMEMSSCKENKDQSWLTFGLQGQVLGGITLSLGLDIGVRSVGFAYGPPVAPWNLLFGASYALDLVPRVITKPVVVEKIVESQVNLREGTVAGKVVSNTGAVIEGAIIGITGRPHSKVVTDPDGTFHSVLLPPGPVELQVTANGFETTTVKTEIIGGQTANVSLTLTPRPPAARLTGTVIDESGKGVVVNIKLAGPQIAEGKSDESGNFAIPVPPGQYMVRLEADQYLTKEIQANISEGKDNAISVTLRTRPAVAGVLFKDGKIVLRQQVTFKNAARMSTVELAPGMPHLLDEIVDILVNHPEIRQVQVQAHWDSSLSAGKAQALTDSQAKAVVTYLTSQGITPERLNAVGMAGKKPLVPNLGAGKMKNRRVEFVVGR